MHRHTEPGSFAGTGLRVHVLLRHFECEPRRARALQTGARVSPIPTRRVNEQDHTQIIANMGYDRPHSDEWHRMRARLVPLTSVRPWPCSTASRTPRGWRSCSAWPAGRPGSPTWSAELGLAQSTVSAHVACLRDCGAGRGRARRGGRCSTAWPGPELMDLLASAEVAAGRDRQRGGAVPELRHRQPPVTTLRTGRCAVSDACGLRFRRRAPGTGEEEEREPERLWQVSEMRFAADRRGTAAGSATRWVGRRGLRPVGLVLKAPPWLRRGLHLRALHAEATGPGQDRGRHPDDHRRGRRGDPGRGRRGRDAGLAVLHHRGAGGIRAGPHPPRAAGAAGPGPRAGHGAARRQRDRGRPGRAAGRGPDAGAARGAGRHRRGDPHRPHRLDLSAITGESVPVEAGPGRRGVRRVDQRRRRDRGRGHRARPRTTRWRGSCASSRRRRPARAPASAWPTASPARWCPASWSPPR